jgi:hypothetical protein
MLAGVVELAVGSRGQADMVQAWCCKQTACGRLAASEPPVYHSVCPLMHAAGQCPRVDAYGAWCLDNILHCCMLSMEQYDALQQREGGALVLHLCKGQL